MFLSVLGYVKNEMIDRKQMMFPYLKEVKLKRHD